MPTPPPTLAVNLMAEVARLTSNEFRRRAQHIGLTPAQARVLYHLSADPGLTQAALAERLDVHPVSVTQIVDRLVKAGWVRRTPHHSDGRALSLHLTEAAEPRLVELRALTESLNQALLKGLSAGERRQLELLVTRLRDNLVAEKKQIAAA